MFVIKNNIDNGNIDVNISLRSLLSDFLNDEKNDITSRQLSDQIGVSEQRLRNFLNFKGDIDMNHAINIMELLGLSERQLVVAYNNDMDREDHDKFNKTKEIAYVYKNFDIQTLKKIGIIKRSKIDEYSDQICAFFGFESIYEFDSIRLGNTLFSKSRLEVGLAKQRKMTNFWLKCAYHSFIKINNPYNYDKELLLEFLNRISKFSADLEHGLEKVVHILYRLGVTVLIQEYVPNTTSFGVAMIVNDKPCIVITDMNKLYYKLWMNLLHELHHIIYDWEILERVSYHITDRENPELIFNEELADKTSQDLLIHPNIQKELHKIVSMRFKVNRLANQLNISPCIIYGVYLEQLTDKNKIRNEFARLNNGLLERSSVAVTNIRFDPISQRSLTNTIDKMKETVYKKIM